MTAPFDEEHEKRGEGRASSDSTFLNELVERCLERFESEGSAGIEDVCSKHPEYADAVRRRLEGLARLGLLEEEGEKASTSFPERFGEYHLERRLASGGMGVVHVARRESDGRRVALKLQRPDQFLLGRSSARFRREIEAIRSLRHPGIVPVFDSGETRGIPWFAMELVPGASLADVIDRLHGREPAELSGADFLEAVEKHVATTEIRESAPPDARVETYSGSYVETCLRIIARVAETLAHAHERGIVHRDVKPGNVMVTPDGRVLLLDFGLAIQEEASRLTRTGAQLGSLPYLAPERLRGESSADPRRSEIYSLGVTLYELLCLRSPFQVRQRHALERSILQGVFERPTRWNGSLPLDAETVCLAAMERRPEDRYPSTDAFANDLRNVLGLRRIRARRPGFWRRSRVFVERHPARATALLGAGILLVVGPLLYGEVQRRANVEVERANADLQRAIFAVEAANRRARSHLDDLLRLSDARSLDELEEEKEDLWPAVPERVPAMDAWLERASSVRANLREHEAALARLESVDADELAFAHGDRTYWLETLRTLVERLRAFVDPDSGSLALVERRRERALSLPERSTAGYESAWKEAIRAIAEHAAYDGLTLEPQMGLVPLGPDPRSGLWEFWHVDSGALPERDPRTGSVRIAPETGIVFVLLPGGTFDMGAQSANENGRNHDPHAQSTDEEPVHAVTLEPFFLARHELTQGQWERVMESNPSYYTWRSRFVDDEVAGAHPVEQVSWQMASTALRRLGLVLPTEAQWEYACRAGSDTVYATGDDPASLAGHANLSDEGSKAFYVPGWSYEPGFADGFVAHSPVGSFEPNAFGLHDMHGNAWEWVRDTYTKYRVPVRAGDGLREAEGAKSTYRVVRGGSFSRPAASTRSADRDAYASDTRDFYLGFRASRAIDR